MNGRLVFASQEEGFPYQSEVDRIVRICAERGWEISANDARAAWQAYSDDMCAGWMDMGEEGNTNHDEMTFNIVRNKCRELRLPLDSTNPNR